MVVSFFKCKEGTENGKRRCDLSVSAVNASDKGSFVEREELLARIEENESYKGNKNVSSSRSEIPEKAKQDSKCANTTITV